ncbi:MAG TPA: hypothetical protein VHY19_02450 [Steroidobacteraceae bacterium]|nr:hypothetical protein [Steroidobacteraceae bacterium]
MANAATLLHRLAQRERGIIQGSCGLSGTFNVQILQELDRPERWVRLEWTCEMPNQLARRASAMTEIGALEALQVAPVQVLPHRELSGVTGSQRLPWADLGVARDIVYEVTHVDIGGADVNLSEVDDAIRRYVSAARSASGNLRAEAWRLDGHANHSTLLFVWDTRAARDRYAAGADTHRFRAQIARGLGAPYDDRLYRRID